MTRAGANTKKFDIVRLNGYESRSARTGRFLVDRTKENSVNKPAVLFHCIVLPKKQKKNILKEKGLDNF